MNTLRRIKSCHFNPTFLHGNIDTLLALHLHRDGDTFLRRDVLETSDNQHHGEETSLGLIYLTYLLTVVAPRMILQVCNPALHVLDSLTLLLVCRVYDGVAARKREMGGQFSPQFYQFLFSPRIKGRHALGLDLSLECIFEDSLTLGVLHLVTVFAEAGHLLHHAHHLVLDLTVAVSDQTSLLQPPLLGDSPDPSPGSLL